MTDLKLGELAITWQEIVDPLRRDDIAERVRAMGYADRANRILAEKLAKCPVVFGNKHQHLDVAFWQSGGDAQGLENQTHIARLVCIEEVKK